MRRLDFGDVDKRDRLIRAGAAFGYFQREIAGTDAADAAAGVITPRADLHAEEQILFLLAGDDT